jgi:uncharacterized protein
MKRATLLLICIAMCASWGRAQDKSLSSAQTANPQSNAPQARSPEKPAIDPAKEKDIRQLLEVAGTKERMTQVMGEMEKSIRPLMEKSFPEGEYREKLIDAFFVKFHAKMDLQKMLDIAVPIYDRYFSADEIKELIQFYSTPLGKKSMAVLPRVMTDMMNEGRKMGEELGRESMLEVLAEHPEFEKAIQDASKPQQP